LLCPQNEGGRKKRNGGDKRNPSLKAENKKSSELKKGTREEIHVQKSYHIR